MKLRFYVLKLKELYYRASHKDTMEIKLEKYRLLGAKIGGGGAEPFPLSPVLSRISLQ